MFRLGHQSANQRTRKGRIKILGVFGNWCSGAYHIPGGHSEREKLHNSQLFILLLLTSWRTSVFVYK